jgi:hypothetical protein
VPVSRKPVWDFVIPHPDSIGRTHHGRRKPSISRIGVPSRRVQVAANCISSPRFVDVLRTHERVFDIRLHDVSRSGNAFVWRFRCRELVLSQGAGLLARRSHDRNMGLPDMVVDKFVFDRSQNGAWSCGHVCVRVARVVTFLMQLKNAFSPR